MRGAGEGTIFQRADGMWVGRLPLPSRDGKRRRTPPVYGKTRSIVMGKLREQQRRIEQTGDIPTDNQSLAAYLDYWMAEVAERTRRPRTADSYRSVIHTYIVPAIGKVKVAKLTGQHVRKLHHYVMDDLGKASTTARNAHSVLSAALKDAVREGRISQNPCANVAFPVKNVTDLAVLTTAEARRMLHGFAESSTEPTADMVLWATFLLTGARRGEIIGLTWDAVEDLDPDDAVLDLSWQLQRLPEGKRIPANYEHRPLKGGLYLTRPKSKAGHRVIPLVSPLSDLLREWRTLAPDNPYGLVFTRLDRFGQQIPLDPDWVTAAWREFADRMWPGKHVRLHDIRHTTVDLLLEAGVEEDVVMEICGWSERAMVRHYKSRAKLTRRKAGMERLSAHLAINASDG